MRRVGHVGDRQHKHRQPEGGRYEAPLVARARQLTAEQPPVGRTQRRHRLLADILQQRRQQILFILVMPGVEPHRAHAEVAAQFAAQQVHQRAFARAPLAGDGEHQRRGRALVLQKLP